MNKRSILGKISTTCRKSRRHPDRNYNVKGKCQHSKDRPVYRQLTFVYEPMDLSGGQEYMKNSVELLKDQPLECPIL